MSAEELPFSISPDEVKEMVRILSLSLWAYKDFLNKTESNPMRDLIWEDLAEQATNNRITDVIGLMEMMGL